MDEAELKPRHTWSGDHSREGISSVPGRLVNSSARPPEPVDHIRTCGIILRMATPIGPEAQRSNAALEPLAPLIGEWRTIGTHPLVPGTTFHGRTSFQWAENGAFMLMHSEIDEPEVPSAVAVIGSDDAAGTFTMVYFDERETSRTYIVEAKDGEVSWHRDAAGFAQGMVLTIAADGTRLDARGTMSRDGGAWEDDLQLTYERIT